MKYTHALGQFHYFNFFVPQVYDIILFSNGDTKIDYWWRNFLSLKTSHSLAEILIHRIPAREIEAY